MASVVFVEDASGARETFGSALQHAGHDFFLATNGRDGIELARRVQPDIVVVDLHLPDIDGVSVIESILSTGTHTRAIMVTGFATIESCRNAMKLGAYDYLEKPVDIDLLLGRIECALRDTRGHAAGESLHLEPTQPHALIRLADPIVRFIASSEDAPTLRKFGRITGVSAGGFRNWCRTAELKAKRTLAFARGLRATVRQHDKSVKLKNLLSIVDIRTRRKFLVQCGGTDVRLPGSVNEYLERQQFIADPEALAAVRAALAALGLCPPDETTGTQPGERRSYSGGAIPRASGAAADHRRTSGRQPTY